MSAVPEVAPEARLRAVFEPDPAREGRLRDRAGRSLLVDEAVAAVYRAAAAGAVARDVVRGAADPELARTAINVLVRAEVLAAEPAPPALPAPPVAAVPVPPPISLVIVNYNGAGLLQALLESIHRQAYPDLQVIVVDNASADGSRELLAAARDLVEPVLLPENRGFAAGFNAGLARAGAPWVGVMNTDLELAPGALQAWAATAQERPRAAAIAAKLRLATHPLFIQSMGNSIPPADWGSDNFMGALDLGQFDHVDRVFSACFAAALLSREALERVGPPDPAYFLYYEDTDWCYRARLAGYEITTAPGAVVRHRFGGSVAERGWEFKLRLVVRNRIRFALVNLGPPGRRHLRNYVVQDVRNARLLRRAGEAAQVRAYIRAYADLALRLPQIALRRRRNRRLAARGVDERALLALNAVPSVPAHVGDEALISEPVLREWYRGLFETRTG